jgi:hypothetical protein
MPGWITETGREALQDGESTITNIQTATSNSVDTSAIDHLRQGVDCKRTSHFFNSMQPKMFVGEGMKDGTISHKLPQTLFGVSPSFVEFNHSTRILDGSKFNPVTLLDSDGSYPTPILSNYGPQQNDEAVLEPFTIHDRRLPDNEGIHKAHGIYASVEAGSSFDRGIAGTKLIEQTIRVGRQSSWEVLVEDGETQFGSQGGSVTIPGYYKAGAATRDPVIDWGAAERVASRTLTSTEPLLEAFVKLAGVAQAGGVAQQSTEYFKRLLVAGTDAYGPRSAELGSDSITYAGWVRGS